MTKLTRFFGWPNGKKNFSEKRHNSVSSVNGHTHSPSTNLYTIPWNSGLHDGQLISIAAISKCSEPPPAHLRRTAWMMERIGNHELMRSALSETIHVIRFSPPPQWAFCTIFVCVIIIIIWRRERDVKKRFNSRRNVYSTSAHSAYIFFLFCSHRSNHTWR